MSHHYGINFHPLSTRLKRLVCYSDMIKNEGHEFEGHPRMNIFKSCNNYKTSTSRSIKTHYILIVYIDY